MENHKTTNDKPGYSYFQKELESQNEPSSSASNFPLKQSTLSNPYVTNEFQNPKKSETSSKSSKNIQQTLGVKFLIDSYNDKQKLPQVKSTIYKDFIKYEQK